MMIADCSYGYAFDTVLNGEKVSVTVLITASGEPIVTMEKGSMKNDR